MLLPGRLQFVYREPYSDDPYSTMSTNSVLRFSNQKDTLNVYSTYTPYSVQAAKVVSF